MDAVLPSIMDTLSSNRPLDSISEELTEILGFDELDFISELLQHHEEIAQKVPCTSLKSNRVFNIAVSAQGPARSTHTNA